MGTSVEVGIVGGDEASARIVSIGGGEKSDVDGSSSGHSSSSSPSSGEGVMTAVGTEDREAMGLGLVTVIVPATAPRDKVIHRI